MGVVMRKSPREAAFALRLGFPTRKTAANLPRERQTRLSFENRNSKNRNFGRKRKLSGRPRRNTPIDRRTLNRETWLDFRLPGREDILPRLDEAVRRAVEGKSSPADALQRPPKNGGKSPKNAEKTNKKPPICIRWDCNDKPAAVEFCINERRAGTSSSPAEIMNDPRPTTNDKHSPKPPPLQFGIKTLLGMMVAVGLIFGTLRWIALGADRCIVLGILMVSLLAAVGLIVAIAKIGGDE